MDGHTHSTAGIREHSFISSFSKQNRRCTLELLSNLSTDQVETRKETEIHNQTNCARRQVNHEIRIAGTPSSRHGVYPVVLPGISPQAGAAPEGRCEKEYRGKGARRHYLPSPRLSNKTKQTKKHTPEKQKQRKIRQKGQQQKPLLRHRKKTKLSKKKD